MLLEINSYSRGNTRGVIVGVHLGDSLPDEIVCTLISLKQRNRAYGKSNPTSVYEMVVADESMSLFKVVLNSGLSGQVEDDPPKIGSILTLTSWKLLKKNPNTKQPLVDRGIFFVDSLSWNQAPQVPSQLEMMDKGITPVLVEFDHDTSFFDVDYVQSVMDNSTFSISESHGREAGTKLLYYYSEKLGGQLDNMWEHIKWGRSLQKKKKQKLSPPDSAGLESENFDPDPRCDCITEFDYHQCVVTLYPLVKCDTEQLFSMARERVGDHNLVAASFEEMPASKQRWCYYWWYAVNIFHLKSKACKLPSCFVNEVRNKFGEEDGKFTGFRSAQDRLEEATFS